MSRGGFFGVCIIVLVLKQDIVIWCYLVLLSWCNSKQYFCLLLCPPLIPSVVFVGTCTDLAYEETVAFENAAIDVGIGVGLNPPPFALVMLPVFPTSTFDEIVGIWGI